MMTALLLLSQCHAFLCSSLSSLLCPNRCYSHLGGTTVLPGLVGCMGPHVTWWVPQPLARSQ